MPAPTLDLTALEAAIDQRRCFATNDLQPRDRSFHTFVQIRLAAPSRATTPTTPAIQRKDQHNNHSCAGRGSDRYRRRTNGTTEGSPTVSSARHQEGNQARTVPDRLQIWQEKRHLTGFTFAQGAWAGVRRHPHGYLAYNLDTSLVDNWSAQDRGTAAAQAITTIGPDGVHQRRRHRYVTSIRSSARRAAGPPTAALRNGYQRPQ